MAAMADPIAEALYDAIKLRDAETMQKYTTEITHSESDRHDLLAEVERLRASVPSWAALHDLLVAKRDTATDVELTNTVMALITGVDHE